MNIYEWKMRRGVREKDEGRCICIEKEGMSGGREDTV